MKNGIFDETANFNKHLSSSLIGVSTDADVQARYIVSP